MPAHQGADPDDDGRPLGKVDGVLGAAPGLAAAVGPVTAVPEIVHLRPFSRYLRRTRGRPDPYRPRPVQLRQQPQRWGLCGRQGRSTTTTTGASFGREGGGSGSDPDPRRPR